MSFAQHPAAQRLLLMAATPGHITVITPDDVSFARELISRKVRSEDDIFFVVASLNLLNAAIKREEFKRELTYAEIKGQTARLLSYLCSVSPDRFNVDFWIDCSGNCAYIEIKGFQFSFHQVRITRAMEEYMNSGRNVIRPWRGIKLQRIGGELFRFAVAMFTVGRLERISGYNATVTPSGGRPAAGA